MNRGQKVLLGCAIAAGVFIALCVASAVAVTAIPDKYAGLTEKQRSLVDNIYQVCKDDVEMGNNYAHDCEKENAKLIQHYLDVNARNAKT